MADISKVQLPSGGVYDIKDSTARQMISGGVSFNIIWTSADYTSTAAPTAAKLATVPSGVKAYYNSGANYGTGTLAASADTVGKFYLVYSKTQTGDLDVFDEYATVGPDSGRYWEKIGDTQVDLSNVIQSIYASNGTDPGTPVTPDSNGQADITSLLKTFVGSSTGGANVFMIKQFSGEDTYSLVMNEDQSTKLSVLALTLKLANVANNYFVEYTGPGDISQVYAPLYWGSDTNVGYLALARITNSEAKIYTFSAATGGSAPLVGTKTVTSLLSSVTLNKQTDIVLGESTTFTNSTSSVTFSGGTNDKVLGEDTTFALTSGSVTHGTPSTDEVLGVNTTFNVTDPTISLGGTTKYLSASASGGGAAWNSKDQKTVVTGYASPSTATFVKSVSAETNKNLVTTTVPNVTGNDSVSIPNVTGNTSVTIPNVTSAGSASTWSFTMGTGDNSETLIIGGQNSVAPTLGTSLTATNTTLGTALSASKVTLGTAITVATGATSTTGTGDAIVTGVTVGDSATAITGLGTPSTANVIGASSTFTNTQPSVTLTANASSGTGRITYLEAASPTATGGAVSPVTSGTGSDKVTAIIGMPISTVGTAITVGTNDKVTAITSVGTATAAAQTITVGTNDKVTALTDSTSISAS